MTEKRKTLSTSALARALGKSSRQMFAELEALGWITREDESWQLTAKGEFEGGCYVESKRFGRYVAWPESVTTHRALVNEDSQLQSASALGKALSLSAVQVNRLLAELGWIKPAIKGWQLTEAGQHLGGRQTEESRTGVPYVLWPNELLSHPALQAVVASVTGESGDTRGSDSTSVPCLDGHQVRSDLLRQIDNWLYLSGVAHAVERRLPIDMDVSADFYIPAARLFIEVWDEQADAARLASKMQLKTLCQQHDLNLLVLDAADVDALDDLLARRLLKEGISTR